MDKLQITGGNPLNGTIEISGAKNAALPLMTASLLTDETLTLTNMPHLKDISTLVNVLSEFGVDLHLNGNTPGGATGRVLEITAKNLTSTLAHYDLVRKMRASILVLGPLLARTGEAVVSLPGGCAIGTRPVDLHIQGLEQMGAEISLDDGYISATAPKGLSGADIIFPKVSVGATENLMMAATLAKGTTRLINAAREPEINDLGECLIAMGARIEGLGTDTITIEGVEQLHGATHAVIPDRIETGTYAIAVAMTGGRVTLTNCHPPHIRVLLEKLALGGIQIEEGEGTLTIARAPGQKIQGVDAMTEPYPGFPTDIQAQFMSMLCIAEGAGMITETVFENRFMHVPELARMGANITVHGSASALVRGVKKLKGAQVMATDLRASVSLVLAGLVAEGDTTVNRIYHLDRGYERLVEKLAACGADLKRISENEKDAQPLRAVT